MCTRVTSSMHISHGTVCYKVVKLPHKPSLKEKLLHKFKLQKKYVTFFQCEDIELGKEYIGSPTLTKNLAEKLVEFGSIVGRGFIHSFKNKEIAIEFAKSHKASLYNKYVAVIECIIPDETPYFDGLWEDIMVCDSYISTNLKYVKRVY